MVVRWLLAAPLALALSSATVTLRTAHADPTPADMESARELFKRGKELREKGDLSGALEKMKAAWALAGTPILGLELGRTHAARLELIEAREACLAVGRIPAKANESPATKTARAEAAQLANELKARIPSIAVKLSGAPLDSIKLTIDGISIPFAAVSEPRRVNPGKHVVVASAGGPETTAQLEIAEGDDALVPLAVTLPARVVVEPVLEAPRVVPPPPAPVPPPVADDRAGPRVNATAWTGIGLLGAGLVAGSITGGVAWSIAKSVGGRCVNDACPPETHADIDTGRLMGNVATTSFVVAGVGAVLTAVGFAMGAEPGPAPRAALQPLVAPGMFGVRGAF